MTSRADSEPVKAPLDAVTKAVLAASIALLLTRFSLAESLGFGDAEALYATYSLHRQASYLDHPGLIGWIGSLMADTNGVISPAVAHRFTSVTALAVAWTGGLVARAAGASWRAAMCTILALTLVPEMGVGLFAYAPDLLLALCWMIALALALVALRSDPSSVRAMAATVGAGVVTGVAILAKLSGALLGAALLAALLTREARSRWKTPAPYAALGACALCVWPLVSREWKLGFPMLHHRLIHTQVGFGLSLRNGAALLGGQLLYVTPLVLIAAIVIAIDLGRNWRHDGTSKLLLLATVVPLGALGALTLVSRVAEPHWIAPAYLGVAIHLARVCDRERPLLPRWLSIGSLATSALAIVLVYVAVRYPVMPRLLGRRYQPRYDLVNDLYVWRDASKAVQEALDDATVNGLSTGLAVVGPHWVICAQVQAALGNRARVGCETEQGDDFDSFYPRPEWRRAKTILYVTDDRFDVDPQRRLPEFAVQSVTRTGIRRGGVLVRMVRVMRLGRLGIADRGDRLPAPKSSGWDGGRIGAKRS